MRQDMECVLYAAGVDLVLSGHVHAYERMYATYDGGASDCAPVYLNLGDGGNREVRGDRAPRSRRASAGPSPPPCPAGRVRPVARASAVVVRLPRGFVRRGRACGPQRDARVLQLEPLGVREHRVGGRHGLRSRLRHGRRQRPRGGARVRRRVDCETRCARADRRLRSRRRVPRAVRAARPDTAPAERAAAAGRQHARHARHCHRGGGGVRARSRTHARPAQARRRWLVLRARRPAAHERDLDEAALPRVVACRREAGRPGHPPRDARDVRRRGDGDLIGYA